MTSKTRRLLIAASTLLIGLLLTIGLLKFSAAPAQAETVDWIINSGFDDLGKGAPNTPSWPWETSQTFPGYIRGEVRDGDNKDGDNEFCVDVINTGNVWNDQQHVYTVQVRHRRLEIVEDRHYTGHFRVYAKNPGFTAKDTWITMKIAQSHQPYMDIYSHPAIRLTPDNIEEYVPFEFYGKKMPDHTCEGKEVCPDIDDTAVELTFHLGDPDNAGKTICFDDIYLTDGLPHERHVPPQPPMVKFNHAGYFAGGAKLTSVSFSEPTEPAPWFLLDAGAGYATVKSGTTEVWRGGGDNGYDTASGDYVHTIRFSDFTTPGKYALAIYDPGNPEYRTEDFWIGDDTYAWGSQDSLRYFYLNRSGTALLDPLHVDEIDRRGAGHPYDASGNPNPDDPNASFDGSVACISGGAASTDISITDKTVWKNCVMTKKADGSDTGYPPMFTDNYRVDGRRGWYDAGDHGKYVVNGGISVWTLLNRYEQDPSDFIDGSLDIPESGNGIPDILDEARWELEFMLNMQVPPVGDKYQVPDGGVSASGLVHHMLHDTQWTDYPYKPDDVLNSHKDYGSRAVYPPSIAATLNLAAVGAQCARIWASIDPDFSARCQTAAEAAFWAAWDAAGDPQLYAVEGRFNGGGPYDDNDVSDEFYWAASELLVTTGEGVYDGIINASPHYLTVRTSGAEGSSPMTWKDTAALGTISLAVQGESQAARDNVIAAANEFVENERSEGYGTPYKPGLNPDTGEYEYAWGSNSFVLNEMIVMGLARDFVGPTGNQDYYLNGMISGMDYLLGRNPMGMSYISLNREAVNTTRYDNTTDFDNPHHRTYAYQAWPRADLYFPPVPGWWVSGGPNSVQKHLEADKSTNAMEMWENCHNTPQKCYIDDIEAFAVNEVTINWNAPLAWVTTYLNANRPIYIPVPDPTTEPTVEPTVEPTDEPTTEPDPVCTVTYSPRDDNGSKFSVDVTVYNNSENTIGHWSLAWTFPGNQKFAEVWNANYQQEGQAASASGNQPWNDDIPPNESRGFGFNVSYSGTNENPTEFALNDQPCSLTPPSSSDEEVPGLSAGYSIRALQPNSFSADVVITNTSDVTVNGWTVKWTFPGNQQITQVWNAGYRQDGNQVTMWDNQDWNKDIAPGGTASGFGFNVSYSGSNAMPTDFQVIPDNAGGAPGPTLTPGPNPGLPVKVVINNDWGSGYCAVVTVTNNTSSPVDWQVAFDVQGKIYTFWNAIWTQAGNKVTAGGVDWNNILKPGESTRDVGFCANK